MTGRVAGKVVVVTGAAGGMGAAGADALVREGATVVAVDLSDRGVHAHDDGGGRHAGAGDAGAADRRYEYRRMDVTDAGDWAALADHLRTVHGRVDGMVNNAGVTARARLLDLGLDDLERVERVNVGGPLLGMQALVPLMEPGSSIVNVGSVAGLTGHYAVAYTASKWALRGLSKAACVELGPSGIRVNVIHPGFIETPMTASAPAKFRAANTAETPLGRTGGVEEVAPLVVYLISDESSFVTGAEIAVDGGFSSHGAAKSISDALRP